MTDPREAKLPKWAQDLLEAERTRAALAWPTEPDPEPRAVFDGGLHSVVRGDPSDGIVFEFNAYTCATYSTELRGRHVYSAPNGIGSRPDGPVYATEADARLALRWKIARDCARRLRKAGN
jgi:hypothetical protein